MQIAATTVPKTEFIPEDCARTMHLLYTFFAFSARIIGMNLRESFLPTGWYPRDSGEISRFLSGMAALKGLGKAVAAIAPHAGWRYSGKIAARATAALGGNVHTLVVIGGHLPAGYPPLFAMEDAVSTPLGAMAINAALRAALIAELGGKEDRYPDNTVEVLLPMARFFFPDAALIWMRLPAELRSFEAGKAIAAIANDQQCAVAALASTDLTHYGRTYGFTPQGTGPEALRWVKEVNDRRFIDAVLSGDPAAALERAEEESSSCSAGAVLGAMGFASARELGNARLLEYGTSIDSVGGGSGEGPIDTLVGYAAMAWGA
jgi:AmmeMemoRadiSam system protein B